VIGAGWIGTEVAASARDLGRRVTLVDPGPVPFRRTLGHEVGAFYRDLHAAHGVVLRLGTAVASFRGSGRVEEVRLADGSTVAADLVVVGVGARPRVELAAEAGLAVDNGVLVDEHLRTSAPDVFAAGDVANAFHPLFDTHVRVEHWANALNQGPVAARSMLGRPAVYDRIPYFYSDQYDVGMEYSGHAATADRVVFRGDRSERKFHAFWLDAGDHLVAGMSVNIWDATDTIQDLVRRRARVDVQRLRNTNVPLDALAGPDAG
jgi:3-phenylpropionate/trans-cinnamate dioxygenase ferredoxin reductase subunit